MKGIETLKKVIAQHRYRDAELLLEWHFDIFDLIKHGLAEPL